MGSIEVERVNKRFGHRTILDDINISLDSGDVYVLFGPNGSGKSTLMLILSSLMKSTKGAVKYENVNIQVLGAHYRHKVGLVTHTSFLYENLSAIENLKFYAALYGVKGAMKRIEELSELYYIGERMNDPIRMFSRGMKQRVSIIRAFLHSPLVVFLDEPYTGLDENGIKVLESQISAFGKSGRIIFLTTHNLERGYNIATRFGILQKGRILSETLKEKMNIDKLSGTYKDSIRNETL